MEKIREKLVQRNPHRKDQIESIKARIEELDKYKIELESFYIKMHFELIQKGSR